MPDHTNPAVPFSALGRRAKAPTIARLMNATLDNPALLSLAAGFTDNATLPLPALSVAARQLAERGDREPLQYGANQGRPRLRALLAEHLQRCEPALDAGLLTRRFFVTNGSQQALYLAMQVLCDHGDIVLVDRPSYFVFLEMLAGMGVQAVSIPVDRHGRVDAAGLAERLTALRQTGKAGRIKALYLVSYFSNPSSRSLEVGEKQTLARVLQEHELVIPVVEDAAYRDLYFVDPPAAPSILSMAEWSAFPRLYLSTLTKPFATGLKVGYGCCTDETWLAAMLHTKGHHDFGSANYTQALLETVLADDGLERQLQVIRPAYAGKMRLLHETLADAGLREAGWRWHVPDGGLYLWLEAPPALDAGLDAPFCRRCIAEGVLYVPGELCFGDDIPRNFVRLSYGVLAGRDLEEAGRRFARVAQTVAH